MIIVADGEANGGYPTRQAEKFKNAGGKIYTVGFLFSGNKFNNLSSGKGYQFTADNADQINLAMNTITQNIVGLISDPMGKDVALLKDQGISVKLGDQDTTPATVLNGNTIRWTKTDGFSGTVTMKYKVKVKDSAKTGKVLSIPLNDNATFNYVHNGTSHSVAFPQPAAQAAALTVSYKVGDETVKTEEDYTLLGENAAFTKTIPSVGDTVEIKGTTYYVSSTDGSVPEQLASEHYRVTVNLSETPPILGTVTVTVPNKTVTYDGTSQTGDTDYSTSGLPKGYTLNTTYIPAEGTNANAVGYEGSFGKVTITRKEDNVDVTNQFTIKTIPGKLIIDKKAVTVTADNKSKVYGEENPKLTYTENGFVGEDTLTTLDIVPTLKTRAETTSPVGEYPITFSNKTEETTNYTISYIEGTLTVTGSATVTVDLADLIQKELTLEEGSSLPQNATFKVKVTESNKDNPDTFTGETASTSDSDSWTVKGMTYTAPFNFTGNSGNRTLQKGQTYYYQVTEDKSDPVSGVEYDSTTYLLTIKVEMDESYSASYTIAPTGDAEGTKSTDVTEASPLTIQNTYQAPDLSVTKQPYKVKVNDNDILFNADTTVAHVGDTIVWKVSVTNNKTTPASTQLKETLTGAAVYSKEEFTDENKVSDANGTWTAKVSAGETKIYYVTYKVQAADIPNGKIVNAIVKDGDNDKPIPSDHPVSTWDTKQLKSATKLNTSDWTTKVTLTLPTVKQKEAQSGQTIAISKGSKVEDTIGKKFTLVGIGDSALENGSFTLTVGGKEITGTVINGHTVNFGEQNSDGIYPYTVDYAATSNKFDWNINEDVYAGTEVTLSYKLKLTTPNKTADTYGVEDLNGDGKVDGTDVAVDPNKALYTNESATLYKDANTKLDDFPKPSVSYTVSSGSSGSHSGGSRPSLNTKDHYGYIIGYPVDYYTGQPTTDQTKKPVRPEGKITRAEVATIYFRMLTDESRTKFWSQSSGYSDVKTGDWFNNAVSTLSKAGIIAGYEDGSFRPNGYITRAEFATIAARFFDVTYNGKDLFPDISGHWAKDYINQAANKGFVNGYEDGTFKPDRNITRAEAVTLVNRTLDRHPDKNHFTKDMLVWPDNMDQTKWYYADMQEATNSHTYQMKENSDKTKYENWTKTLPIRNWEALEKAWSNANSSQGNGNVV